MPLFPFINGNLQEMGYCMRTTDQCTLIEQSAIHKIEQSLHCYFVAEFHLPASKTKI